MHKCTQCKKEFGAPATLRIHQNKCEGGVVEKVVRAVKKVVKKVTKKK